MSEKYGFAYGAMEREFFQLRDQPVLAECAEWHKNESKRHKTHRLFMEANNLGPPYPKSYEKRHADFAKALLAVISPNAAGEPQPPENQKR